MIRSLAPLARSVLPAPLHSAARAAYWTATGRTSRRLAYWRLRRQSRHARTYLEKIRHKAAFDRDPLLIVLADKIAVRGFVADAVGSRYLTTAHAQAHDPAAIDWDDLPREYVCKANHGSGGMVVVWEGADPSSRLPVDPSSLGWGRLQVHPDHADPALLQRICSHWLTLDYSWSPGRRIPEWAYQDIPRGILVEELLRAPDGGLPDDIKLYVIHGRVRLIRVMTQRRDTLFAAVSYSRDWEQLPVQFVANGRPVPVADPPPPVPSVADELVQIAETLGACTDSVRVDLYALGSRVVFGEMTVYPAGGQGSYLPSRFDDDLGALWTPAY